MVEFPAHGPRALFLVLSGPSGAGKSTLIRRFVQGHPDFSMSISVTTRPPRTGEQEGSDYFFVDAGEFQRRIAAGTFLEHAQVFGAHHYGTPRAWLEKRLAAGKSVVKDIDVQGAAQIRASFPAAVQVFVVPPDRGEIAERLRRRATDSAEVVARRLAETDRELAQWRLYDYLVFNGDLDRAVSDLATIVAAERMRIRR